MPPVSLDHGSAPAVSRRPRNARVRTLWAGVLLVAFEPERACLAPIGVAIAHERNARRRHPRRGTEPIDLGGLRASCWACRRARCGGRAAETSICRRDAAGRLPDSAAGRDLRTEHALQPTLRSRPKSRGTTMADVSERHQPFSETTLASVGRSARTAWSSRVHLMRHGQGSIEW